MTTLSHERGTHGVELAAQLDSELREAIRTLSLGSYGADPPIVRDPAVRDALVSVWIDSQALRITNLRAISTASHGGVPGPESTIAKLHWSELNQKLAGVVGDALGPSGLELGESASGPQRWGFARLRARGNTIEAGTSEVLRNIIAERVLGLPRSR